MAGLMDYFGSGWGDPKSAAIMGLSRGLLGGDLGQGFALAQHGYSGAMDGQMKRKLLQSQMDENLAQTQERAMKLQLAQAAAQRESAMRAGIPGLFRQPGMTGGEPQPQMEGGVPMFSRPMGAGPMQATPGGFDVQAAIRLGMDPKMIQEYAGLGNIGRSEVARTIEATDAQGRKIIKSFDKYNQPVGTGEEGYVPPVQVNRGDRVDFVRPAPGVSLGVNMSLSERDASGRGWASLNETKRHNTISEGNADAARSAAKVPAGYRMKLDGSMEAIPGGPADLKAGAEGQKRVGDAKDVLSLLNEVDTLLPKATGSYAGLGYDAIAGGLFGASTKGAEATAQLRALQGALIAKMPKMSGPQSDKDVQLYREMAGQVGDPSIPVPQRQAAASMIRKLNEKYAGMDEGSSKPAPAKTSAAPDFVFRNGKLVPATR